jgi:hypothetical protein
MDNLRNIFYGWLGMCIATTVISVLAGGLPLLFSEKAFEIFCVITLFATVGLVLPYLIEGVAWILGK